MPDGWKEHRALNPPPRYIFTENGSINRNGGFNQIRIENKVVPVTLLHAQLC